MDETRYTWLEFLDKVREQLPLDATRRNFGFNPAGGISPLEVQVRNCVADLQFYIPALRENHTTVYDHEDLVLNGSASLGELPQASRVRPGTRIMKSVVDGELEISQDGVITYTGTLESAVGATSPYTTVVGATSPYTIPVSVITNLYRSRLETLCENFPLQQYPWNWLDDMICGQALTAGCLGLIAISPNGQFAVSPAITPEYVLEIPWDSIGQAGKIKFGDDDRVPFDDMCAEAAGLFAKAFVERTFNSNLPAAESFKKDYALRRRDILVAWKEQREIAAT